MHDTIFTSKTRKKKVTITMFAKKTGLYVTFVHEFVECHCHLHRYRVQQVVCFD